MQNCNPDSPDSLDMSFCSSADNAFPRLARGEMHPKSGCLSKLSATQLEELMEGAYHLVFGAQGPPHPMLNPEDCASVEVGGETLLLTTDLIPLVGVDPYIAGRIAVLHAMSDVYACGGVPRWCLANLVLRMDHPAEFNKAVLAGVLQAVIDEGAQLQGGHTIVGEEAMVGIMVIGARSPKAGLSKKGGTVGDRLLLSKPLGVGLTVRDYRLGRCGEDDFDEAIRIMTTSNRSAAERMLQIGVKASTDVTGFGLLGHLVQMLREGQGAKLNLAAIPLLSALTRPSPVPQSTEWGCGNFDYVWLRRRLSENTDPRWLAVLLDPQTNGGLLVAAAAEAAAQLVNNGFHDIGCITNSNMIELLD